MKITKPFDFGGLKIRVALVAPAELAPPNFRFSHYTRMLTEVWIELLGPANAVASRDLDAAVAVAMDVRPPAETWAGLR